MIKDEVMPSGKWEFDDSVTAVFDNMLERSIPAYEDMRELCFRIGRNFVKSEGTIIDIGCSNGLALARFVREYGKKVNYRMYDVSSPMLKDCYERYESLVDTGNAIVEAKDITQGIGAVNEADLVLSVLTLQFTPIEYRQKIISSIYEALKPGAALVIVEKVLGSDFRLDSLFVDEYYKIKAENAYTQEQIQTKRKSLEGVLVPITSAWNEDMLYKAGFKGVDCFWRYLNFAGWVAIK